MTAKNLGLIIIDEEQRFGVTHKEKLKNLRNDIDVLTLTATPIPRTLHMSLVGIRDLSVLEEAKNPEIYYNFCLIPFSVKQKIAYLAYIKPLAHVP